MEISYEPTVRQIKFHDLPVGRLFRDEFNHGLFVKSSESEAVVLDPLHDDEFGAAIPAGRTTPWVKTHDVCLVSGITVHQRWD